MNFIKTKHSTDNYQVRIKLVRVNIHVLAGDLTFPGSNIVQNFKFTSTETLHGMIHVLVFSGIIHTVCFKSKS